MNFMANIFVASKAAVSSNKSFFAAAFIVAIIIFTFLTNLISPFGLIYYQEILVPEGTGIDAPIFIILFSFLLALSFTLHKYKLSQMKGIGKESSAGFAGAIAGIFTSACPICPPLILSFVGVPASIAIFPLGGWEIRILSIALLLVSIYIVSNSLQKSGICK